MSFFIINQYSAIIVYCTSKDWFWVRFGNIPTLPRRLTAVLYRSTNSWHYADDARARDTVGLLYDYLVLVLYSTSMTVTILLLRTVIQWYRNYQVMFRIHVQYGCTVRYCTTLPWARINEDVYPTVSWGCDTCSVPVHTGINYSLPLFI